MEKESGGSRRQKCRRDIHKANLLFIILKIVVRLAFIGYRITPGSLYHWVR